MPYKDKDDPRAKATKLRHYQNNKEMYRARAEAVREELRALVCKFKDRHCEDCKVQYPVYVMELDHRDPEQKTNEIQKLIKNGNRPGLLAELEKCDVVCANCHRVRTATYFGWKDRNLLG